MVVEYNVRVTICAKRDVRDAVPYGTSRIFRCQCRGDVPPHPFLFRAVEGARPYGL